MDLFFDLDNTLWDFDLNSTIVLQNLFKEHELQDKIKSDYNSFYSFYKRKNDELWHLYYKNKITKSDLRIRRFKETFQYFNFFDNDLIEFISNEYVRISPFSTELKPGCIDVLSDLKKRHRLHIITNGFKEIQNIKIENCGLRIFFNTIIISEEHGYTKPSLEIFRIAEQLSGAKKENCIMIGDNWVADVEGALEAGWKAIFYKVNERALFEHKNLKTINHLNELLNY